MLPSFCRETVTVTRAPLLASRGSTERDWASAAQHELAGCIAVPVSTADDAQSARPGISADATLYAPPGSDVAAQDRVTCRLGTFRVAGAPMPVASPTGRLDHIKCYLERREG